MASRRKVTKFLTSVRQPASETLQIASNDDDQFKTGHAFTGDKLSQPTEAKTNEYEVQLHSHSSNDSDGEKDCRSSDEDWMYVDNAEIERQDLDSDSEEIEMQSNIKRELAQ